MSITVYTSDGSLVTDPKMASAVASMQQRSEKQEDEKLLGTHVDTGVLAHLRNENNQIVYGRRGTGKTHAFRMTKIHWTNDATRIVVDIDTRTLGSSQQFAETQIPAGDRALNLFRDILLAIHDTLHLHTVQNLSPSTDEVLAKIMKLADVIVGPIVEHQQKTIVDRSKDTHTSKLSGNLRISKPGVDVAGHIGNGYEREKTATIDVIISEKLLFRDLHATLDETLRMLDVRCILLLDEWASLPRDVQPFLAEYIKRGLLPNGRVTIKIAALEHRSQFNLSTSDRLIGIELGSDMSATLDLDDYYLPEKNEWLSDTFADILLRHINSTLPDDYLAANYAITTHQILIAKLFRDKEAFLEAITASQGVLRDFISIVAKAYLLAGMKSSRTIERRHIRDAAREWYQRDKLINLSDNLLECLRKIANEVIPNSRTHSFCIPQHLQGNLALQRLLDARVLHITRRGHVLGHRIGEYFNVYALDYGLYIDHLPQLKIGVEALHIAEENIAAALHEAEIVMMAGR